MVENIDSSSSDDPGDGEGVVESEAYGEHDEHDNVGEQKHVIAFLTPEGGGEENQEVDTEE